MLTWFRDNAKIFLVVIIVTFVILIFVDWGAGRRGAGSGPAGAVARVDGDEVPPEEYDAKITEVYSRLESQMSSMGDPMPQNELAAMAGTITETAFEEMISDRLEAAYLHGLGWEAPGSPELEAYMKSVLGLMGAQDVETAYRQFLETPGYQSYLLQNYSQMSAIMFPAAGRLQNIASRAELDYLVSATYSPVRARVLILRGTPGIPGEQELKEFYDANPDLFTYPPNCRLRYAVVAVKPDSSDISAAESELDSMVTSGAVPDTVVMSRANLLAFISEDSITGPGMESGPFAGASLRGGQIPAAHFVRIVSVTPEASGADPGQDTVVVLHWENALLPGMNALYDTYQAVEDNMATLLSGEIPWVDSLPLIDWGEYYVEEGSALPEGVPVSIQSFALDTSWVDSVGPVFFSPGYQGGYPALIVAKRIERTLEPRVVPFEEALASGELLMTAYSRLATAASMDLARQAMEEIRATGATLGQYAASESLEVFETPEFTVSSVLEASASDPEAYGGILSSREFARMALVAPVMTPIGPFSTGGTATIVEIISREELPMPSDPSVLAPLYLNVQAQHGMNSVRRLSSILRSGAEVEDLREEFMESVRRARAEG